MCARARVCVCMCVCVCVCFLFVCLFVLLSEACKPGIRGRFAENVHDISVWGPFTQANISVLSCGLVQGTAFTPGCPWTDHASVSCGLEM